MPPRGQPPRRPRRCPRGSTWRRRPWRRRARSHREPDLVSVRRRTVLGSLLGVGGLAIGSSLMLPSVAQAAVDPSPDSGEPGGGTSFGPAQWMRIPRIDVDSATVDVGVSGGYYDVPWF